MKKLFYISALLAVFACAKKSQDEQPWPIQEEKPQQVPESHEGMIKVTVWSNRVPYIYRRKHIYSLSPLKADWKEDTVKTNTKVFYETYYTGKTGSLMHLEYASLATHSTSYVKGDSIRITGEYQGKKTTDLNASGVTFALIYLDEMK